MFVCKKNGVVFIPLNLYDFEKTFKRYLQKMLRLAIACG